KEAKAKEAKAKEAKAKEAKEAKEAGAKAKAKEAKAKEKAVEEANTASRPIAPLPRTRGQAAALSQADKDNDRDDFREGDAPRSSADCMDEDFQPGSSDEEDDRGQRADSRKRGANCSKPTAKRPRVPSKPTDSDTYTDDEESTPQGGKKKKKKGMKVAPGVNIDNQHICASLAAALVSLFTNNPSLKTMPSSPEFHNWAHYTQTLVAGHLSTRKYEQDTLEGIIEDIQGLNATGDFNEFLKLQKFIQLAAFVNSLKSKSPVGLSLFDIYKMLPNLLCSESTFRRWVGYGHSAASLCAAGSFYFLFLLAVLHNRRTKNWLNEKVGAIVRFAAALRMPDPATDLGDWIIHDIIPSVTYLHTLFRLKVGYVLNEQHLTGGLNAHVCCGDLDTLDRYFGQFKSQAMGAQGRNMTVWAPFYKAAAASPGVNTLDRATDVAAFRRPAREAGSTSAAPTFPRLPSPIPYEVATACPLVKDSHPPGTLYTKCAEHSNFVAIKTAYNPNALLNVQEPHVTDATDRKKWTPQEMPFAEAAAEVKDLPDLAQKLKDHFDEEGVKERKKYLRVHPELFDGKELMILDQDDKLIALINGTISKHITRNLAAKLKIAMSTCLNPVDQVRYRDSKEDHRPFIGLHFEIYARYCADGRKYPTDVSPFLLVDKNGKPVPLTQTQPYESSDLVNHTQAFEDLREAWQLLFDRVRDMLRQHLPDEFEELVGFADALPHWRPPAAYPFSGFVVNLNVMTRGHRDTMDTSVCLVFVLGEHEGGELCLVEPGLTVKLREGDFIIFPSVIRQGSSGGNTTDIGYAINTSAATNED
ncbi:hypothetical protein EUX98_g8191, partial [Antrodiella citrinella]